MIIAITNTSSLRQRLITSDNRFRFSDTHTHTHTHTHTSARMHSRTQTHANTRMVASFLSTFQAEFSIRRNLIRESENDTVINIWNNIDLLPNYGPGTSKRYRKPVLRTTQSFPIARRETFDVHQILLKLKFTCLPFLLSLICLPLTISFGRFAHKSACMYDNRFGGVFWGVCFRTLGAVVLRFWQSLRRLRPLKIGLVILTNLRKC